MSEPVLPAEKQPEPPVEAPEASVIVGKYRLIRRLGEGGMGAVWEACHVSLERRFAIKFLLPELVENEQARQRFEREAKTVGKIESDYVVGIFDVDVSKPRPFIVMEFLSGEDLAHLLQREERLAIPRAVELVRQAARGLERAHEKNVVHRDIKPKNLFVTQREDGTELCKVLDFGVAKVATGQSGVSTKTGNLIGTIEYMSPEQLRGERKIDARADVYSLGCVLYECIAGQRPHDANKPHELMYRSLHEPIQRLETLRTGVPRLLADAVHRALEKDKDRRFPTVSAFAEAIAPFSSTRTAVIGALADAATLADSPHAPANVVPVNSKPGRARLGLLGGSASLVIVLASVLLGRGQKPQPETAASSAPPMRSITSPATPARPLEPARAAEPASSASGGFTPSPPTTATPRSAAAERVPARQSPVARPNASSSGARRPRFDLGKNPYATRQ